MADIKIKDKKSKGIKVLDKTVIGTQKFKNNLVETKQKTNDLIKENNKENEFGENVIINTSNYISRKSVSTISKINKKSFSNIKNKSNIKKDNKKILKENIKGIKKTKKAIKNTKNVGNEGRKAALRTKKAIEMTKKTIKTTIKGIKIGTKAASTSIKSIIAGTKSLMAILTAGSSVVGVIIISITLVALLVGSIFGIFFSGYKTNSNSITMDQVVSECHKEFSERIQNIQDTNPHDDYVFEGDMASWKDILIVYTVEETSSLDQRDVVTIDENKKNKIKETFWSMNILSSEVKTETVIEQGTNALEMPKEVQKKVLHITVKSKTLEQVKLEKNFNYFQNQQISELLSDEYKPLWDTVIYGENSGEYTKWRQKGAVWSSIRIGNTNSTISDIGCLVTSVAILIEKSGVETPINPFNPGTFVEALNKNGGFSENGNLQYAAINKVVPKFSYVGNVNLRGLTKQEKIGMIKLYLEQGYYLTAEVKGATEGNQHWVAIMEVNENNIKMVDPASNYTDLWNAYEHIKTTQFNYFKTN